MKKQKNKNSNPGNKRRASASLTSVLVVALAVVAMVAWGIDRCTASNANSGAVASAPTSTLDESWNDPARPVPQRDKTLPRTTVPGKGLPKGTKGVPKATPKGGQARQSSNPLMLEMPATARGEKVLRHTGYTLSYNNRTNCPNWVAWELTSAEAKAQGQRSNDFAPDPLVEERNRVTTDDYRGSGYDRGHMCPAADMKWSPDAQRECFYMSNMCPQLHALNAGCWERLETACRRWATQEGSVYIACGPVFKRGRKVQTIGREHQVRVPDGFFKVVLSLQKGKEKAIGFYYAHNDSNQTMESAVMTVDEVEAMTGYDFFYQIDKTIEQRVEASANLRAWR